MPDRKDGQRPLPGTANSLRFERDRHVAFAFAAADLLIEADVAGKVVAASGAAMIMLGASARSLIGQEVLSLVVSTDRPLVRHLLQQVREPARLDPTPISLSGPNGRVTRVLFGACRLPNLTQSLFISAASLPEALLQNEPDRDEATNLLTVDALKQAAGRLSRKDGESELKLVRLDGLAGAVEQLSAARAAAIMAEIGGLLRASSVGGDSAGLLGKDAFGLVTKADPDDRRAGALAAEIAGVFREAGIAHGVIRQEMAGIRLASDGMSETDLAQALGHAMTSFISAKAGDFKISSLQSGLKATLSATVERFAVVRQMIADGNFSLVFQPVVFMNSGDVHHFEALTRFPNQIDTFETIVFSEDVGLVAELDLMICRRALTHLEGPTRASVAVNLSGRSVQNEAFRSALSELVRPLNHLRDRLLFELTESAGVEDIEGASAFLRWLRKLGHGMCLDDFGAGAAAYSYLRRFDVDHVKIDGPFLKAAAKSARERALIRSITGLCHEIGCEVIGEMIEDSVMKELAEDLKIDYGQGWFFGKPVKELPGLVTPGRRKGGAEVWG